MEIILVRPGFDDEKFMFDFSYTGKTYQGWLIKMEGNMKLYRRISKSN